MRRKWKVIWQRTEEHQLRFFQICSKLYNFFCHFSLMRTISIMFVLHFSLSANCRNFLPNTHRGHYSLRLSLKSLSSTSYSGATVFKCYPAQAFLNIQLTAQSPYMDDLHQLFLRSISRWRYTADYLPAQRAVKEKQVLSICLSLLYFYLWSNMLTYINMCEYKAV